MSVPDYLHQTTGILRLIYTFKCIDGAISPVLRCYTVKPTPTQINPLPSVKSIEIIRRNYLSKLVLDLHWKGYTYFPCC